MKEFSLAAVPGPMEWLNQPLRAEVVADNGLTVTADARTDWFADPAGEIEADNAPVALFTPPPSTFLLSARVTVPFAAPADAGVLMVFIDASRWAKLCFEYSPQRRPIVVSVVTRGVSDDANAAIVENDSVWLRIHRNAGVLAFHYSTDAHFWHLVRYFTLGSAEGLRTGFSAQSPTGEGCSVTFSDITCTPGTLTNVRDGT